MKIDRNNLKKVFFTRKKFVLKTALVSTIISRAQIHVSGVRLALIEILAWIVVLLVHPDLIGKELDPAVGNVIQTNTLPHQRRASGVLLVLIGLPR